jgi:hypothetical protein
MVEADLKEAVPTVEANLGRQVEVEVEPGPGRQTAVMAAGTPVTAAVTAGTTGGAVPVAEPNLTAFYGLVT